MLSSQPALPKASDSGRRSVPHCVEVRPTSAPGKAANAASRPTNTEGGERPGQLAKRRSESIHAAVGNSKPSLQASASASHEASRDALAWCPQGGRRAETPHGESAGDNHASARRCHARWPPREAHGPPEPWLRHVSSLHRRTGPPTIPFRGECGCKASCSSGAYDSFCSKIMEPAPLPPHLAHRERSLTALRPGCGSVA